MANKNKKNNKPTPNDNTNNNSYEQTHNKNKLYFKIPDFFLDKKQSTTQWIDTCTTLFNFNNITDKRTICTHLINHLPHTTLIKISDKLNDINKSNKPLAELRDILQTIYPCDQNIILEQCYQDSHLGDRKPSEYLNELQNKLKEDNEDHNSLVKFFFYRNLPVNVKNILLANKDLSLTEQAILADQIHIKENFEINAINKFNNPRENTNKQVENNELKSLKNELEKLQIANQTLKNEIENIKRTTEKRNEYAHKYKEKTTHTDWCYYHQNFGKNAFKCTFPCSFKTYQSNSPSHPN